VSLISQVSHKKTWCGTKAAVGLFSEHPPRE
jgi:hypothetical protein